MSQGSAPATKQTWLIIMLALVMSIFIYGLLCYIMTQSATPRRVAPELGTLRPILILVALGDLAAAVAYLQFRTQGKLGGPGETLMKPSEFQTHSIVAMALAEACTIIGLLLFFLGNPLVNFVPFALASLAVMLGVILPKGLKYWTAWDAAQKPQAPSPFA